MKKIPMLIGLSALLSACGGSERGTALAAQSAPVIAAEIDNESGEASPLSQPEGDALTEAGTPSADPAPPVELSAWQDWSAPANDDVASADGPAGKVPSAPDAPSGNAPAGPDAPSGDAAVDADAPVGGRQDTSTIGAAPVLYVAPSGSDSNPGSLERPFRSIIRAARAARPGSKVLVAPGVYEGGFRTSIDGAANARIVFLSMSKWGAKIVPPQDSPNKTAWDNRGSYVDIVGFDVDGSNYKAGKKWAHGIYSGGSYVSIRNNHVHHIAQNIECTRAGGAAIGVDSYYHGVKADVIANLVHDIGPANCRFVQGIYVSTSGRIKNNMIYRIAEAGIHLWHDANNVIITNNTVTQSDTGIIVGGGNYYFSDGPNDYTAVFSNIVYDNKMGISEQGQTGRHNSYRNNLVYQNSCYDWRLKNGLIHTGTVSAAPLFVDNSRNSTPSLKLSSASPAVGRASPTYAESVDFAGRPRDARAGYDIGALQH